MTAKEINLAGGQKVYNKEKEDALLEAQKTELVEKIEAADTALDNKIDTAVEGLVEKIETADTALDSKIDDAVEGLVEKIEAADAALDDKITDLSASLGEAVDTKDVHVTNGIKLDTLTSAAPVSSSAGVGYDEAGNLIPIKVVAQIGLPENAPFIRTDTQGNAKKGTIYNGDMEPDSASNNLVTEAALAKRGNARTDVHTTVGEINENLIFRVTQHTANYEKSAFSGLFYEVASFMESDQIPVGAKLIYLYDNMLRFCTTYPPYSGLQFGADESVDANHLWFESIDWMSAEGISGTYNLTAGVQALPVGNTKDISSVKIGYTNAEGIEVNTTEVPAVPAYNYNVEGKVGSLSYDIKFSGTTATVVLTPDAGVTATDIYVEVSYTTHAIIVVPLGDFSYTTPVIKVQDEEVAPQNILSFVDYRENATDELLDKRSAETAAAVKSINDSISVEPESDTIAKRNSDGQLKGADITDSDTDGTLLVNKNYIDQKIIVYNNID